MQTNELSKRLMIVSYLNFLRLSERARKTLRGYDDFLVSIKAEDYAKLSAEEKKKLVGVALTDNEHNVRVEEASELRQEVSEPRTIFPRDFDELRQEVKMVETYAEKHQRRSRPYVPRQILKRGYNSKKRGGR